MADKEEKAQETESKKKSPLKLIIILFLALVVLGGGGFFAYMKFLAPKGKPAKTQAINQDEEEPETESENVPKVGQIFDLDPFIVNLVDKKESRYLKVKISLELKGKKITEELTKRLPQVRDIIIEILSSKSFEELATLHGKEHLKSEIMIRLNSILKTGSVKHVFFTEFVMQ